MYLTAEEVKDYWNRYCARHGLSRDIVAEGERYIDMDYDYWADHPMKQLRDVVMKQLATGGG